MARALGPRCARPRSVVRHRYLYVSGSAVRCCRPHCRQYCRRHVILSSQPEYNGFGGVEGSRLESIDMKTNKLPSNYDVWGRQCGDGWNGLIQPLQDEILRLGGRIRQIKEKFGGLRFHYELPKKVPEANRNALKKTRRASHGGELHDMREVRRPGQPDCSQWVVFHGMPILPRENAGAPSLRCHRPRSTVRSVSGAAQQPGTLDDVGRDIASFAAPHFVGLWPSTAPTADRRRGCF
jgi:hypothetical protein